MIFIAFYLIYIIVINKKEKFPEKKSMLVRQFITKNFELCDIFESLANSGVTRGGHARAPPSHRLVLPGHREKLMTTIFKETLLFYYPVIDSITTKMNKQFSQTNMEILRRVSSSSPDSQNFLEIQELKSLCQMLHCDFALLTNEIRVLKPMLQQSNSKDMVDLY